MKNNDPFCITGWGREGITDPMEAVAEIFSYMDMGGWRRLITKMAAHALSGKIYHRRAPGDVLVAMKVVRSALMAAYALQDAAGKDIAVTRQEPWQYGMGLGTCNHWDDFPRVVSFKEYCRPCSVFKKRFKKRPLSQWINDWEQLVEAALSPCNLDGERWVLRTRTGLLKLLEAAHLVWMRDGGGGSAKQGTTHEPGGQHKTAPTS
ncbi:hypothetical protein LL912_01180 [Niabella sp. CC-SYL272]|uniref:hypothetical protein n=1 Tax=Niabella agricola TaxID=2891571 RepID=UPI001F2BA2B8|nr:hypothetical protein [Niabella agricola]MCF3107381.1 hypothetical protein [Niabella agricola]